MNFYGFYDIKKQKNDTIFDSWIPVSKNRNRYHKWYESCYFIHEYTLVFHRNHIFYAIRLYPNAQTKCNQPFLKIQHTYFSVKSICKDILQSLCNYLLRFDIDKRERESIASFFHTWNKVFRSENTFQIKRMSVSHHLRKTPAKKNSIL